MSSLRRVGRRLAGHVPATAARLTARTAGASVERLSGFGRRERGVGQPPRWFQNGGNAATSRVLSRHRSGDTRAVEWRARQGTTTRAECARVAIAVASARASFETVRATYLSEAEMATGATTPPLRIGFDGVFFDPPTGARNETASASGIFFVLCVPRAFDASGVGTPMRGRRARESAAAGGVEPWRKVSSGRFSLEEDFYAKKSTTSNPCRRLQSARARKSALEAKRKLTPPAARTAAPTLRWGCARPPWARPRTSPARRTRPSSPPPPHP